jgi:heme exporter protein B
MILGGITPRPLIQAVLYWLLLFFCSMNSMAHIFIRERELQTALLLRFHVDPLVVFAAKYFYNLLVFIITQIIITPLFILFLHMDIPDIYSFLLICLAGSIALVSSVTILAAITTEAGGRGALFTIISFPIVLPVLLILVKATHATLQRTPQNYMPVTFLIAYSIMLFSLSLVLFPHIWHDA